MAISKLILSALRGKGIPFQTIHSRKLALRKKVSNAISSEVALDIVAGKEGIDIHKLLKKDGRLQELQDYKQAISNFNFDDEVPVKRKSKEKPKNHGYKKQTIRKKITKKKWDVFICHATENKKTVATPLAKKLKKAGLDVWYDEFELDWGSRLMRSINIGLKNSLFGIVILSKQFFKKDWAQRELEGLHSLSIANEENKILPLLYKMTHKQLTNYSPLLSDIVYKKSDEGLDKITRSVIRLVKKKKNG